ncbi:MAG TPA: hypothetical protein P5294_10880 [Smithellaceae bacterium]|nr:hypothetical protein [Smithellaceae bacterium]HRS90172.1 hypothetical protein [Smithellaceae bacterium]HRV27032.1 hypothetical protein [Smithellaceae bacterium]
MKKVKGNKNNLALVGTVCFIIGVVVSILAGFIRWEYLFPILTVLGLIVGFLNVTNKEVQAFLIAAVSLVIISALGADQFADLPVVGETMSRIYAALLAFVGPATIIVALKSIYSLAKN